MNKTVSLFHKMLAYNRLIIIVLQCLFHFLGSSLNIIYPNLNAGKYALRVVGKAVTGERAKIRRVFLIGNITTNNYHHPLVASIDYGPLDQCVDFLCLSNELVHNCVLIACR